MKDLPRFKALKRKTVLGYVTRVFGSRSDDTERLINLIEYPDGHYRALFSPDYFAIQPGKDAPSKSQWNTLKKRMKRIDDNVFVFKEHGQTEHEEETCCYVDFGFFAQ